MSRLRFDASEVLEVLRAMVGNAVVCAYCDVGHGVVGVAEAMDRRTVSRRVPWQPDTGRQQRASAAKRRFAPCRSKKAAFALRSINACLSNSFSNSVRAGVRLANMKRAEAAR